MEIIFDVKHLISYYVICNLVNAILFVEITYKFPNKRIKINN